jgi:glycosyltransferase involved in cell wall biosynthesis
MPKRIIIDDGLATIGNAGGIGNYSKLLFKAMSGNGLDCREDFEVIYRQYGCLRRLPRLVRRSLYLGLINLADIVTKADVCHYTNHYMPVFRAKRKKYITTVHDLAVWKIPDLFTPAYVRFARSIITRCILRSDHIITVSNTVKNEILDMFDVPESKISVCYNAVGPPFRRIENYAKRDLLLFVGNIDPHKNLSTLVKAFALLKNKSRDYNRMRLIIAGNKRAGTGALAEVLRSLSLSEDDVKVLGYVSDEQLVELYNSAAAVIMPSLYEGFGLPVIEAMACQTPVIVSDIPVFREIADGGALFYSPSENEHSLCDSIDMLLSSESLRKSLQAGAKRLVERYTMADFARRHCEAYKSVCCVC